MKNGFGTLAFFALFAARAAFADPAGAPPPVSPPPPASPPPAAAPSPTLHIVNDAKFGDNGVKDGMSPAILRAEVMLDRVHASPGVIDGRDGENFHHAVETYAKVKGLDHATGAAEKVWDALVQESGKPVLMNYTTTDADVAGPFFPDLPRDYAELAKLKTLGYRSVSQKIAAKFHLGEQLLAALNPGVDLTKPGQKLVVPDVPPAPIHRKVARILVDKHRGQVMALDRKGDVVASYPATIGSRELPSPSGSYRVRGIAHNPIYYYDPQKNFVQGDNKEKLKLPPGPNNPVGLVFIALTKPTYGLHGTPDPSEISKTASHGCVRMTNWDALELASLVSRGLVVDFKS